ncbi:MAG: hypothetical protein MHM6MM_008366 [Cercozoa sp. M6MM]
MPVSSSPSRQAKRPRFVERLEQKLRERQHEPKFAVDDLVWALWEFDRSQSRDWCKRTGFRRFDEDEQSVRVWWPALVHELPKGRRRGYMLRFLGFEIKEELKSTWLRLEATKLLPWSAVAKPKATEFELQSAQSNKHSSTERNRNDKLQDRVQFVFAQLLDVEKRAEWLRRVRGPFWRHGDIVGAYSSAY